MSEIIYFQRFLQGDAVLKTFRNTSAEQHCDRKGIKHDCPPNDSVLSNSTLMYNTVKVPFESFFE